MDSDGIVAGFYDKIIENVNDTFGTKYLKRDITDYNIEKWLPPNHAKYAQDLINSPGFFLTLEPYPGAIESLHTLHQAGHHVLILTSYAWYSDTCANDKLAWYKKHAPFLPIQQIMMGHAKYLVNCDVAVDDGPDKIRKYRQAQPGSTLMSIKWPYHAGIEDNWDFLAEDYDSPRTAWSQLLEALMEEGDRKRLGTR